MDKKKAVICTILYAIVLTIVLIVSSFIKNEVYGISLYQIIINVIGNIWLVNTIVKFYEWLRW